MIRDLLRKVGVDRNTAEAFYLDRYEFGALADDGRRVEDECRQRVSCLGGGETSDDWLGDEARRALDWNLRERDRADHSC